MRQSTVVLLVILACTIFAAWFFKTHHRVERSEYIGYSGEARYNEFLAAELLLQEVGIEADSKSSLTPTTWLPEYDETIVSRLTESMAVTDESTALFIWVSNGGHLVLFPPKDDTQITSEFLEDVGLSITAVEYDYDGEADDEKSEEVDDEPVDYVLDLDNTYQRIELYDADEFSATLSDDHGNVVVRRGWGGGFITVIADETYFYNDYIDDFDHARLFLDSVDGYVRSEKVWFVLDAAFPTLWALIWENGFYVVIASAVAIFLWLWSVMPRFGPAIEARESERRSILEHVAAAGHFAWRHHGTSTLTTSSIAALVHDAELLHPGIGRLSADEQAKILSKISGVPAQTILDVLLSSDESRHREFTHNVQNLQRVRKNL